MDGSTNLVKKVSLHIKNLLALLDGSLKRILLLISSARSSRRIWARSFHALPSASQDEAPATKCQRPRSEIRRRNSDKTRSPKRRRSDATLALDLTQQRERALSNWCHSLVRLIASLKKVIFEQITEKFRQRAATKTRALCEWND